MPTLEEQAADIARLTNELADARARLHAVNEEAKGHRLNADKFRQEADQAKAKLAETEASAKKATRDAALKVLATEAGMVDLDGLKLLDEAKIELADDGSLRNGAAVMAELKTAKPWLFTAQQGGQRRSTSSPQTPPAQKPAQSKRATEMTDDEYRAARQELLAGR